MSDEHINFITTSNYSITPELSYFGSEIRVKFNGSSSKQDKIAFVYEKTVNISIVYEINNYNINSYPILENYLFSAVSVTKNNDIDKYEYSGYGIGFHRKGKFSVGNEFGRNCIIFRVDMSSSVHVDSKKKDILILGKGPTQGLDGTASTAEKKYSINFTENNKKFCLSLHYNRENSYLFINDTEIIRCKAKDSEINAIPLCLGDISKEFSVDNMKKA